MTASTQNKNRPLHSSHEYTPSLGCFGCRHLKFCGGLHVKEALYDCYALCCGSPESCEAVCEKKPKDYIERHREIQGFDLNTVPRSSILPSPELPGHIPLLYHGTRRTSAFDAHAVCLSLSRVLPHLNKMSSPSDLASHFSFRLGTKVIVTGVDRDPEIERWWGKGMRRRNLIQRLKAVGVSLVTTPNYSLFTNRPRTDDMHSMKRIALVHDEFQSEGLVSALHINARTEKDWNRWADYVSRREEISHVAVEFGTGARFKDRSSWHIEQLKSFAEKVNRPLSLVVRGAVRFHGTISDSFEELIWVDSGVFMKTQMRQRAVFDGKTVSWFSDHSIPGEPIDGLFQRNWDVVHMAWLMRFWPYPDEQGSLF